MGPTLESEHDSCCLACTAYAPKHRLKSESSSAKQPLKYFLKQSLKHFLQAQLFYSLIFDRLCFSRL